MEYGELRMYEQDVQVGFFRRRPSLVGDVISCSDEFLYMAIGTSVSVGSRLAL
jgi:hypothetical protein